MKNLTYYPKYCLNGQDAVKEFDSMKATIEHAHGRFIKMVRLCRSWLGFYRIKYTFYEDKSTKGAK